MGQEIECFSLRLSQEIRQTPGFRRWMGYAAMLDGNLLIPTQAIDESLLSAAQRDGVSVHRGMGIKFISVDWVLAQSIPPMVRQAYENMKAQAIDAYRTRSPSPEVSEVIAGTLDNDRDRDALLDWLYAAPGRTGLILEDPNLNGMEFRTSASGAHIGPAAYRSLMAHLESIGVDPKGREWKPSDWN